MCLTLLHIVTLFSGAMQTLLEILQVFLRHLVVITILLTFWPSPSFCLPQGVQPFCTYECYTLCSENLDHCQILTDLQNFFTIGKLVNKTRERFFFTP